MINKYTNLALSDGGVWGISYAGAFEELDRFGILQQIRSVAGTSAGSMVGLLLALGYNSKNEQETLQTRQAELLADFHGSDETARDVWFRAIPEDQQP